MEIKERKKSKVAKPSPSLLFIDTHSSLSSHNTQFTGRQADRRSATLERAVSPWDTGWPSNIPILSSRNPVIEYVKRTPGSA
jgi:hypothetical protein